MSMQAEVGRSFIYDLPKGAFTARSGAEYHLRRYGILPGIGLTTYTGRTSFGVRAQLPVFNEKSEFENIQNPFARPGF